LGGRVEALYEKWEVSQKMAAFTRQKRSVADGGPPAWIPFGMKITQEPADKVRKWDF
jgi:hypothetical protein